MRLYNSLTRRVDELVPIDPPKVGLYTCGPTVYSRPHIGNYRSFVFSDMLRRSLEFAGYQVTQVINITDVGHLTQDDLADARGEDKMEKAARERNLQPLDIAREIEAWFHEDLATLGCLPAHQYPRATDNIAQMIEIIGGLLASGHAYEREGNVYFDVSSFPDYGKLSGNTVEGLVGGASGRVDEREDKAAPEDFALWKVDPEHVMQWDAPWGRGFPGWHIECSAMAMRYLGPSFDIHTGGPDNKFPHHECEIAQSESFTGRPFVTVWMHPAYLTIGNEKMSKSKGKLYTIPELVELGYRGADIRYALVQSHYRSPMQFDVDVLDQARTSRGRIQRLVDALVEQTGGVQTGADPSAATAVAEFETAFSQAVADDLSTPTALAALHSLVTTANTLTLTADDAALVLGAVRNADTVLGILTAAPVADHALTERVVALLHQRAEARAAKDFARADAVRDELTAMGVEVLDGAEGTRWRLVGSGAD